MMQDMGSGEGGGETQAALEQFWPKVSKKGRIYGRPRKAEMTRCPVSGHGRDQDDVYL